ncbi:MAG: tetratricopeptide repeat protein, partial [Alphaproteobacteria bacterium]
DNILDIQALDLQEKARNFIKSKDYDKSINHYNNAIKYNPSNSLFYFERGQVYLILENYEKSADDLIIAVSLNNDLEKNNLNLLLGKIFFKQGNINLSLEYMDKELKVNPSSNEALMWQVRSLSEIGQYEEASIYADKLIKYNPDSPDGYAILGDIKLMLGNINESNLLHEKALSIDPEYNIATKTKVF